MKRTVTGVVILFFAITVSILSVLITKNICDRVTDAVDKTETSILEGNEFAAIAASQQMEQDWEQQYKVLSSYIGHEQLERCEVAISAVKKYLILGDYAAALVMCSDIRVSAEHIYISERPAIWNIF